MARRLSPTMIKKRIQWTDALRSEDYLQGSGVLESGGYYCCLGVLCDVVTGDPYARQHKEDELLTGRFLKSMGLTMAEQDTLAVLNDRGFTFEEIADVIDFSTGTGLRIDFIASDIVG